MDLSRYQPGDEITEGAIYRRVPNRAKYVNLVTGKPRREAYEPRPEDRGSLSAYLIRAEAEKPLHEPRFARFGLSQLDIAQIRAETNGRVRVVFTRPDSSHVDVYGCEDDEEMQETLARLAVMVIPARPQP